MIEADFAVFLCIIVLHECALNWAFGNTIDLVFCAILTKTNLTLGLEKENSMINFWFDNLTGLLIISFFFFPFFYGLSFHNHPNITHLIDLQDSE